MQEVTGCIIPASKSAITVTIYLVPTRNVAKLVIYTMAIRRKVPSPGIRSSYMLLLFLFLA